MATSTDFSAQNAPASLSFGDTFFAPQSQFLNLYKFSIPTATLDSLASTITLGSFLGIANLQSKLYNDNVTPSSVSGGLLAQSTAIPLSFGSFSGTVAVISPITLAAGKYVLEVRGDVVGAAGGSYSGILNISPVPEAEEWALMLSGLGLIGLIGTRSRRKLRLLP